MSTGSSNRRPEVPDDIKEQIEVRRAEARAAYQAGDKAGFAQALEAAWALIPDPKPEWDYYPDSFVGSLVRIYVELDDVENAKKWSRIAYEVYHDPERESVYVLMMEGDALFKLGLLDEAYDVFDRVYGLYGRRWFTGEHLPYLEFYLKERARHDG